MITDSGTFFKIIIILLSWRRPGGCLVCVFKQQFSVFKQYFTYFYILFHSHVLPQIFSNNNFQFLNTHTKQTPNNSKIIRFLWVGLIGLLIRNLNKIVVTLVMSPKTQDSLRSWRIMLLFCNYGLMALPSLGSFSCLVMCTVYTSFFFFWLRCLCKFFLFFWSTGDNIYIN